MLPVLTTIWALSVLHKWQRSQDLDTYEITWPLTELISCCHTWLQQHDRQVYLKVLIHLFIHWLLLQGQIIFKPCYMEKQPSSKLENSLLCDPDTPRKLLLNTRPEFTPAERIKPWRAGGQWWPCQSTSKAACSWETCYILHFYPQHSNSPMTKAPNGKIMPYPEFEMM